MEKSAEAFRTISEVSELLDTPAHVLRFWESRFSQVRPVKRAGGRRYYRPGDVALLSGIKRLLHEDGITIRGVQKILKEQGIRHVSGMSKVDLTAADAGATEPPAPRPDAAKRPETPAWPVSPSPDAADDSDRLMPDPDDIAAPVADPAANLGEAPMDVDVPTLPFGEAGNVLSLTTPAVDSAPERTAEPEAPAVPDRPDDITTPDRHPPAAAMLRAMDALRVRDKRSELTSVYLRLVDLKERLARSDGAGRD